MTKSPNVIGRILYTVNVVNVVIGVKKKNVYVFFNNDVQMHNIL
jgi:hypothetical protein